MVVHQVFAMINKVTIGNIVVADNYELANQLAKGLFGKDAFAQECTMYPVSIGDKFVDGHFMFKDGVTPVPRMNTAEQDAQEAQAKVAVLSAQQAEIAIDADYRLSLLELGLS